MQCTKAGKQNLHKIDNVLLLTINTYQEFLSHLRFMRELKELKISSDYSSCDPSKLDYWLKDLSPDLGQYTYQLLQNGVDKPFLSHMSEEHLRLDCGVHNGIHRAKILQHIRGNFVQS